MIKTYKDLLKKVEKVKVEKSLDISSGEDLSVGIMNLISIEEHLFFTYNKTKDKKYLNLLNEIRIMRVSLLKEIIKDYEGEVWCISKHLLAASMRVMEVGTKKLKSGDKKSAEELFKKSYQLYNLFWGLNIGTDKKAAELQMPTDKSVFSKIGDIVQNALDCCRE
jgi:hypothetical protein